MCLSIYSTNGGYYRSRISHLRILLECLLVDKYGLGLLGTALVDTCYPHPGGWIDKKIWHIYIYDKILFSLK